MTHIVASDGFGRMVHAHPHTGEKWTREPAGPPAPTRRPS